MNPFTLGFLVGSFIGLIACLILGNMFYAEFTRLVKIHNDTVALLTKGKSHE